MGIRALTFLASVLLTVTAVACSEDADGPVVTPTTTAVASTATPFPPTPEPSSTPPATPIAETATLDGCPVDDVALCQFALDAQDAINAEILDFFTSRLRPSGADCRSEGVSGGFGCQVPGATVSEPIAGVLGTQSDCCAVLPSDFQAQFQERLDRLPTNGTWRVYGVERRTTHDLIILIRGNASDAAMVSIGTASEGELGISYVIVGTMSGLYIFLDSEFFTWI